MGRRAALVLGQAHSQAGGANEDKPRRVGLQTDTAGVCDLGGGRLILLGALFLSASECAGLKTGPPRSVVRLTGFSANSSLGELLPPSSPSSSLKTHLPPKLQLRTRGTACDAGTPIDSRSWSFSAKGIPKLELGNEDSRANACEADAR